MKKFTLPAIIALLALSTGCATQKDWAATGGSKADGIIKLSYEVGEFEKPQLSESQGLKLAIRRCSTWGYNSAEAFGGVTRTCNQFGGFGGCARWMVTKEYQCLNKTAARSTSSRPAITQPRPAQQASYGKTAYQAEKLAEAIGCDSTLRTISTSPDEVYQVECGNGQIKILSCDLNKCKVAY